MNKLYLLQFQTRELSALLYNLLLFCFCEKRLEIFGGGSGRVVGVLFLLVMGCYNCCLRLRGGPEPGKL